MNLLQSLTNPGLWALVVTSILLLIGFLSSFLPILPGTVIIWAGIVFHKLWMWDASVTWTYVGISTGLMLLSLIADYACTVWGARRFGASWRGAGGALIGGLVGLFIPPQIVFIIIGPFVGAIVAELLGNQRFRPAVHAGVGTLVGAIIAFGLKLGIGISMILGFYLSLF